MKNSVTATFGGRELTFTIARQDLPLFEAYTGIPAFDMFTRITRGQWTVEHVKSVLNFASVSAAKLKELRQYARILAHGANLSLQGSALEPHLRESASLVNATLSRNPVAQYAALAQAILAGALFGLSDADAVFAEQAADGE